jgi:hypothetical protein
MFQNWSVHLRNLPKMENKLKVRGGNTYKSKTNAQSNYN